MKLLVLNAGSSSLKYQMFSMPEESVVCSGIVERIGLKGSAITHTFQDRQIKNLLDISNHKVALRHIVDLLINDENGVIPNIKELKAVGHRVVHGGHTFTHTTEITDDVKERINKLFSLAPLHNPSNLEGITVSEEVFPDAIQVAVFDTAFHQTIPKKAFTYAIPYSLLEKHYIRLYGFHGTSHKYVSQLAAQFLAKETSKIITLHLGNGSSATAVVNGKSVDHSLGFSPVNGLVMGTRSGDIDHSLIFYLVNTLNYDVDKVNKILQNKSGLLGLTGYSDLREIVTEANRGDERCKLALDIMVYRIRKYIGAYMAAMNGLDCLVFTAGIGENSELIRKMVCTDMGALGIELDDERNAKKASGLIEISAENSKVKVLVIPTNEELEIARQTYQLCINHHKKTE